MDKKMLNGSVFLLVNFWLLYPHAVRAVIPPDFIFNVSAQVGHFFSVIIIFFTAIFGACLQFFKTKWYPIGHKKTTLVASLFLIVFISWGLSYWYASYTQKIEYQKWLAESKKYGATQTTTTTPKNIFITSQEFKDVTDHPQNGDVVLDARENIEYDNGSFPGSVHIRFADLKAGRWVELPQDKSVFVICWSGIRGKEVATFLRTKGIMALYLEEGASGWVQFGGTWNGNIKFLEKYTDPQYQIVFTTTEVKEKVRSGVILVDTREPDRYAAGHIAGSVNIPLMYTPTSKLEEVFSQVPPHRQVVTVCDGYVNCFDAKLTGVELERREHQFVGRYNKPWEYDRE